MKKLFPIIIITMSLLMPARVDCDVKRYLGKKALYINSYHKGYYWSDLEQQGFEKNLANTGIELRIVYMDTKNNPKGEFSRQAGSKVKSIIEEFKPDVLIVAGDNAFRDVVMPYYRDVNLSVVFCGINNDISVYGAPYKNTTGIIEVGIPEKIYEFLRKFAVGDKIGFLGADTHSSQMDAEYLDKEIPRGFIHKEFVKDFKSWKKKIIQLQKKVDMLIVAAPLGISDWKEKEAEQFVLQNIRIPIGTESLSMMRVALVGVAKIGTARAGMAMVAQKRGKYAANIALKILDGQKPSAIPIITVKKGVLMLNLKIANKLGIVLTSAMLKNTKIIYR
ncbi:MAG: ABC transporter substrate binding protein [Candidatus Omnitrophota bacterium]|nr:ABC transporter substrate binding protein [Candidatus Omnitrophota bacterium]